MTISGKRLAINKTPRPDCMAKLPPKKLARPNLPCWRLVPNIESPYWQPGRKVAMLCLKTVSRCPGRSRWFGKLPFDLETDWQQVAQDIGYKAERLLQQHFGSQPHKRFDMPVAARYFA